MPPDPICKEPGCSLVVESGYEYCGDHADKYHSEMVHIDFPKVWAPYLQAVILGALNDFDSDCRWHLNELQKRLGQQSV
jgi:hypothetical protein